MKHASHYGEPFTVAVVLHAGVRCRFCNLPIPPRTRGGRFDTHGTEWECRDCLYAAPFTEFNRWRKDHPEHDRC